MSELSAQSQSVAQEMVIAFAQKAKLERDYRQQLFRDLLQNRTKFSAGPYEAHIQYSNFCNMSCIMCWDGDNPPTKKTPADLLEKIGQQLGSHLSVVTPYSGSEPLVLTWDETRSMAQQYGILLCITTNVQYLDEKKFHELKDITETLIMSIDSHVPAVFEKIRPRSNSKKVFANLATAARLCVEHNVESIVNIVFMTQNAPMLTDTLEYLADLGIQNINVIQLLDVNGNSRMYDPLLHYSEEYVAWIKRSCIKVAKERKFRLIWSISGYDEFDFREPDFVPAEPRKEWNDNWDVRMKRTFPGFCRNAYNRLRIDSEGDVAPCCYATQGELSLGNLNEMTFDEIWNGEQAQDLRRGMFCDDVPVLCRSCRFHDVLEPQASLPFTDIEDRNFGIHPDAGGESETHSGPTIREPEHALRCVTPAEIKILKPNFPVDRYLLVLSLGGEKEEVHRQTVRPDSDQENEVTFFISNDVWQQLKHNVGYWWTVWAIGADETHPPARCNEIRCLIRHRDLPRIADSKLRYLDQGFLPVSDLGGKKQEGWSMKSAVPERPVVASHADPLPIVSTEPTNLAPLKEQRRAEETPPQVGFFARLFNRDGPVLPPKSNHLFPDVRGAYLESVLPDRDALEISGWIMLNGGAADSIRIVSPDGNASTIAQVVRREDLKQGYAKHETAFNAGFSAKLLGNKFWRHDGYQFTIVARKDGKEALRCDVNVTQQHAHTPAQPYSLADGPVTVS